MPALIRTLYMRVYLVDEVYHNTVFSRLHATLYVTLSVGLSVGLSFRLCVGWSVMTFGHNCTDMYPALL